MVDCDSNQNPQNLIIPQCCVSNDVKYNQTSDMASLAKCRLQIMVGKEGFRS